MSKFIKKLKEIKIETFRLSDFYVQELIELFDYKNKDDKKFILGNNEKSNLYESDIYTLLKTLLKENSLKDNEKEEIIENYKNKYLDNNSSITRTYCLVYIELFIEYYKTKDYKSLFRELYSIPNNELIEKFISIFCEIVDEEYFVKSFNVYLEEKTKYGNKYFSKIRIDFLLNLDDNNFIDFINLLSSDGLVYLKEIKEESAKKFLEKIEKLGNSNINNKLKKVFLDIIKKVGERDAHDYDYKQILQNFLKSEFALLLSKYLGDIYMDLSLDIVRDTNDIFYGLWENVAIVSKILRKENIEELCKVSSDRYFDIHVYENIDGGTRVDKNELTKEFRKYESFNKKLKERKEYLKQVELEQEERKQKEKEKFYEGINKIIEEENNNNPIGISEYLLYQFENNNYDDFKKDKNVIKIVKNQIKRFFKLEYSDPENYNLNFTKKDEKGSSYTTHQFVVNHTFLRCLKFWKVFGFKINNRIRKKAIKYIPFAYNDDLEYIISIIGESDLEKEDIIYLLSIYDGTRTKDDLRYNNITTFLLFYEKYKDSFLKYGKNETINTFIQIINDKNYTGYERKYTSEKLIYISDEKQLLELFSLYKTNKNYFLDIILNGIHDIEKNEFEIAFLAGKELIKRFSKTNAKKIIIDWFIEQLKVKVPLVINYDNDSEYARWISELESELSWGLKEENSFISVFKYIDDLSFEKDIKILLKYSFEIIKESRKEFGLFGNYIQHAVYNFYEGIKEKKLKKVFELEKEISENVKDNDSRILFKLNFLDKLINIYSEKIEKLEINKIYKSVYNVKKDYSEENEKLKEELNFIKKEKLKLESKLKLKSEENLNLENEINRYKYNLNNSVVLFVEGKYDEEYLKLAWKNLKSDKPIPFTIFNTFSKNMIRARFSEKEFFNNSFGITYIGMLDFDEGFSDWEKIWKNNKEEEVDKNFKKDEYLGLCKKNKTRNAYVFLLPIPQKTGEDLDVFNQVCYDEDSDGNPIIKRNFGRFSKFYVELLFYGVIDDKKLDKLYDYNLHLGNGLIIETTKKKEIFEYVSKNQSKELFKNFEAIFNLIDEIIEDSKKAKLPKV